MSFHFRNLTVMEWLKLFGPFVSAFVVGILLRFLYPCNWFALDTVHSLADALMVAGIIGSLLEMFSARFLIERVSDDLAQRLVGRGLPTELQAHIQKITKTKFVWSNYRKRYKLALSENAADKMSLESEISFEVRNYSDVGAKYSPFLAEESFYSPAFTYIEYGISGDAPRFLNEQALSQKTETTSDSRVKKVHDFPKINLPPATTEKFARVLMRYRVSMPVEYTDLTHFAGPTTGVSVFLQDIPPGFAFSAEGEGVLHAPDSQSWEFLGPFVGGQHVRVRWFKKSGNAN
jgi:hypothetical protein